ncbi:ArsR/SmtB family transcription factor [Chloroflexota bacterium]
MAKEDGETEIFKRQAELCKSLSDHKRLRIIHELKHGEKSVRELAEMLNIKQSNTSQHLAVLRNAGVIVPRREGNTVYYNLAHHKVAEACDIVREVIAEQIRASQHLTEIVKESKYNLYTKRRA